MSEVDKLHNMFEKILEHEEPKIIKEYEKECDCLRHGKYMVHCCEFEDGSVSYFPKNCPKCEEERKAEKIAKEAEKSKKEIIERYKASNISPEFFNKDLSDYVANTEGQKAARQAVEDMIKSGKGKIIIIGNNGVGKSMLGSIAVKNLGGKIYTMYEIATRIRQSYSAGSKETELQIVNELINEPLLVIDEAGRIKMSEAIQDWFSYILDKRHSRDKPFIILGNLHFKKYCEQNGCAYCFENYFGKDILSRLKQNSTIVEIITNDKRSEDRTCHFVSDRSYKGVK